MLLSNDIAKLLNIKNRRNPIESIEGGDPNKWMDVKKRLSLLSVPKRYAKTQYGQARGNEPVQYVENIRGYYDLLVWLTEENHIKKNAIESEKIEEKHQTSEVIPTPLL